MATVLYKIFITAKNRGLDCITYGMMQYCTLAEALQLSYCFLIIRLMFMSILLQMTLTSTMEQLPNLYSERVVKVYKMSVLLILLKMVVYRLVTLWPLVLENYAVRKLFTLLEQHTMKVSLKR